MNSSLLTKPINQYDVHDWIYARITDYKCFESLALGKKLFKELIEYWRFKNAKF